MKGISAIIAVVLILLITVALAAAGYMFFSGTFSTVTTTTSTSISGTTQQMQTQYIIESVKFISPSSVNFTIRNTGTVDIDIADAGIYIDDVPVSSYTPNTSTYSSGKTVLIQATNSTPITCGSSQLKVSLKNSASPQIAKISC